MVFDKIHLRNFKCFDEEGIFIENLNRINVIIGKNNSGKSSIIEVFNFLTTGNDSFLANKRNNKRPEVLCERKLSREMILEAFPRNVSGGSIGKNHQIYGLGFENCTIKYSVLENHQKEFISIDKDFNEAAREYFDHCVRKILTPFQFKKFSHLSAERDIQPEIANPHIGVGVNGTGATNFIQQIINKNIYNSDLIEKLLLKELNKIINPDMHFSRILVQQNENEIWEIYFENETDGRIPLSRMGSGIKTILLVLILLYVKPIIEGKQAGDYIFALEELENNLHASLQRRLYNFIYEYSKSNDCIFLLSTHSNIVIDLYNALDNAQIFHINRVSDKTIFKTVMKLNELKNVLSDLDVRASDILQSNGIIWVEGPSDRIYLNKWISLLDSTLKEGNHYSIMFYGGKLLSNTSFYFEELSKELIPLLKLNTNAFVLIDRDGETIDIKLSATKLRIQKEIGVGNAWVTKGREIENYLSSKSIEYWLSKKYNITSKFINDTNTKFEHNIASNKITYNLNKNKYATEIIQYIDESDLNILDLKSNITNLVNTIKKWNNINNM